MSNLTKKTPLLWRYIDQPQECVMVFVNGQPKTVPGDNAHFKDIVKACSDQDTETVMKLVDKALAIKVHSKGLFEVIDGVVHVQGKPCPDALSDRIIKFTDMGLDVKPLVAFWRRLMKNPSKRALDCLYRYLEANNVPIVADEVDGEDFTGCFVAWKSVDSNFKDHRTHTFDNSPGTKVSMPRNEVDEDPNQTCSHGLHVAAWDYAWGFGYSSKYIKVYVDPANVVAVPHDYNNQKMRVCEYFVVEQVDSPSESNREEERLVMGELTAKQHALESLDDDDDDDDDDDEWY